MGRELVQTILARRSVRKYAAESISDADVRTMLEAAMAAPSASNSKPWHFLVVVDRNKLDELAQAHPYGKMLFAAPLCIAVCGDPDRSDAYWVQDCSAATENLLLAATALDLGSVWLGIYPRESRIAMVRESLGIPEGILPFNLIAIGHPAEHKPPRTQYDETRVHRGDW